MSAGNADGKGHKHITSMQQFSSSGKRLLLDCRTNSLDPFSLGLGLTDHGPPAMHFANNMVRIWAREVRRQSSVVSERTETPEPCWHHSREFPLRIKVKQTVLAVDDAS